MSEDWSATGFNLGFHFKAEPVQKIFFHTQTLHYQGAVQKFTVPAGVTELVISCYGGSGTRAARSGSGFKGGLGGIVTGAFNVTPGQVLDVLVGASGITYTGSQTANTYFGSWPNGGGCRFGNHTEGGSGGGASMVGPAGAWSTTSTSIADNGAGTATRPDPTGAWIVAGGGGGAARSRTRRDTPAEGVGLGCARMTGSTDIWGNGRSTRGYRFGDGFFDTVYLVEAGGGEGAQDSAGGRGGINVYWGGATPFSARYAVFPRGDAGDTNGQGAGGFAPTNSNFFNDGSGGGGGGYHGGGAGGVEIPVLSGAGTSGADGGGGLSWIDTGSGTLISESHAVPSGSTWNNALTFSGGHLYASDVTTPHANGLYDGLVIFSYY